MLEQSDYLQVRTLQYSETDVRKSCFVWCPGCVHVHVFWVTGEGPTWDWDGNLEKPTFSPSHLVRGGSRDITCHSYLREGVWEFLPDSTHPLAGQKIEIVKLPIWLKKEGERDDD